MEFMDEIDTEQRFIKFENALITEVEFSNGAITQVATLFNNSEVGWQEINVGVKKALEYTSGVVAMQSILFSIKNGIPKRSSLKIEKQVIRNPTPWD